MNSTPLTVAELAVTSGASAGADGEADGAPRPQQPRRERDDSPTHRRRIRTPSANSESNKTTSPSEHAKNRE